MKFGGLEIGEIVCCLPDKKKTKLRLSLPLPLLCGSHSKSARASPDNVLKSTLVSSKSVHCGGVIAERVNTVNTRCEVNPILGQSEASSQIMTRHNMTLSDRPDTGSRHDDRGS